MAQILKAIPEFKIYSIQTENNVAIQLKAYVKGPGTPVPVVIEVGNAYTEYEENWPTDEQIAQHNNVWQLHRQRRAELLLRRDLLQAISYDISEELANLLAADGGDGIKILNDCGWYAVGIADPTEESEEDDQGKDESGELISLTSQPVGQE